MTLMPIQIRICLLRSEVWRFVGLASTVVGLLCYACSSSFNHLVGEWNLLKIFLYGVFSFIICLTMFFPKAWKLATSFLFEARLSVLVLTATSVYSFYYDEAVTRKTDAYSLISYAAFAIMSLSLSRQTHCGVEVDLLHFFLGCLIVQLMRINRLLAIGGAGFSYSLVILRSSLANNPPQNGFLGLQDQHHVVNQVDSQHQQTNTASAIPVMPPQADTDSAPIMPLESRSKLMDCMEALKQNNSKLVDMLLEQVKEYLEPIGLTNIKDRRLVPDHNFVMDALPSGIINDLHEIVKLMVAAGLEKECSNLYSSCRREFLEQCLSRLGLKELNNYKGLSIVDEFPDIIEKFGYRESLIFKRNFRKWIKASNVAVKILFPSERRLCERVFFGFSSAANLSFMDVCRESMNQLLNLPDTIAVKSLSPKQVIIILDLHVFETFRDLIRELQSLFSDEYSLPLVDEAISVWNRFLVAIRGSFIELENQICGDPANAAVPEGGIQPIARDVMKFLHDACRSRETLEQVLQECANVGFPDRAGKSSSLSVQVARIMELLDSNLEAKSNHLNPALGYLFLMNNVWYIKQEAKDTKLGSLLGDAWIQKQTAKVRQNLEHYQRTSWNEVLGFLKLDNESVAPNVSAQSMREKLYLFNLHFEEICRVHSTWYVSDEQLRKELRKSLEDLLLPAYGKFIGMFQDVIGKDAYEYIEYGIFCIQDRLNNLLWKQVINQ